MKGLKMTLLATACLGAFFLAFLCFDHSSLRENELILRSGFLLEAPLVLTSKKGEPRALHLHLRGNRMPLRLATKLLHQVPAEAFHLKQGDEILFHEKHPDDRRLSDKLFARDFRPIYSLSTLKQNYLSPQHGVQATYSYQMLFSSSFFALIGIAFFILFGRKIGWFRHG